LGYWVGCPPRGLGGTTSGALAVALLPVLREELEEEREELEERPLAEEDLDLPVLIVCLDDFGIYYRRIF
jgi:hypothetical protein